MAGKFELKSSNNNFHFNLKASNGQVILSSESYESKAAAMNAIESVKKNASDDSRYERKESDRGYRFNLKATNGQVIGSSETYTTEAARDNGIESVKKNAPDAEIVEV